MNANLKSRLFFNAAALVFIGFQFIRIAMSMDETMGIACATSKKGGLASRLDQGEYMIIGRSIHADANYILRKRNNETKTRKSLKKMVQQSKKRGSYLF